MGGVGLALLGQGTVNYLNPATLTELPFTYITGNVVHETADLAGSGQDAFITNTNVSGVQFVVPLKVNRISIAVGLNPYSVIEYQFSSRGTEGSKSFEEIVSGDGGINTAFFSVSIHPFRRLYLGATGMFYFGNLRNMWRVIFDSPIFTNTQDEVSRNFTAGNIRLGAVVRLTDAWTFGGVFTPSVTLNADKSITLERLTRFENLQAGDIDLPQSYGFGTTYSLGKKLLLGLDFYSQKWSDFNAQGYVNDSKRIAFGLEYSGKGDYKSSYWSRAALRLGVFYQDLGLEDPIGEKVTELFGTLGVGIPLKWRAGRIDLALEGGRRGSSSSNPFRETVFRFTATVSVGEKWFFRRKTR
ncbi:MAG: hypothetical protein D6743_17020 [Calditrichaeota bacterium]|nr:MAG: hypothetical protein D6743_17020 [Calditrichota bacterium]